MRRMSQVQTRSGRELKHVVVREYLRSVVIESPPGAPAPSERDLQERFGVSRMTVRQATEALVAEGLLDRIPGKGTFIARPRRATTPIGGFTDEMRRRGTVAQSRTLLVRPEIAGPSVARALGVGAGDRVVHWRRVRSASDAAICVQDVYLNEALVPDFLDDAGNGGLPVSLYRDLTLRGLRPTWVEDAFTPDHLTAEEALHLRCGPGTLAIRQQRRALAGDYVVEVSRSVYRADRYTVRMQIGEEE